GHIKKDCAELKTSMELRQLQKEQKKSLTETNKLNQNMQIENISYSLNNLYITDMITEQEGPSTKVSESNYSEKSNLIDNINNQDSASMKSPNSTSMLNQNSLSIKANHKDTDDKTSVTNLDQDVTMELLDSDKKNKTEEKEFTLITSKKNNRKGNKKKNLAT
ncbi:1009_t:CDS:1, partial [Cetraspora pellucida]